MGGSASRAFAEWQRETTLPESGLQSMGWARVKGGLRVLGVLEVLAVLRTTNISGNLTKGVYLDIHAVPTLYSWLFG